MPTNSVVASSSTYSSIGFSANGADDASGVGVGAGVGTGVAVGTGVGVGVGVGLGVGVGFTIASSANILSIVAGPTLPSIFSSLCARWKPYTAVRVPRPNTPSSLPR